MSIDTTNSGAMVALQTLRKINGDMQDTQQQLATGKRVANPSDNAAYWAISKVMEADVAGFSAVQDSLGLGEATLSVAQTAADTTTDLLQQIKEKVVSAQATGADTQALQADIEALREQITSVTQAAQFNGQNLLQNQDVHTSGSGTVSILASLERSSSGVATATIDVTKQDLGQDAAVWTTNTGSTSAVMASSSVAAGGTLSAAYTVGAATNVGDLFRIGGGGGILGGTTIDIGVREGDTQSQLAQRIVTALNFAADSEGVNGTFSVSSQTAGAIDFTNDNTGTTAITLTSSDLIANVATDITGTSSLRQAGGALGLLQSFDVTSAQGADAALGAIDDLIQTSIDSAASIGSSQNRLSIQDTFLSDLKVAMNTGIGTLIDADMEETAARLQSLQVQQQLAVQGLSIANRAPSYLLSLFQ